MPRLSREEQLLRNIQETLFKNSKFIREKLPALSAKLDNIIESPDTKPETIFAIYKHMQAELKEIIKAEQAVKEAQQDKKDSAKDKDLASKKAKAQLDKLKLEIREKKLELERKEGKVKNPEKVEFESDDFDLDEYVAFTAPSQ